MEILTEWWDTQGGAFQAAFLSLLAALFVQLFYLLFIFVRTGLYRHQQSDSHPGPVSVVICAKNEERRLRDLVPLIMEQDYPDFEVVVVDDSSWDDTISTLRAYQVRYPKLHAIKLDEDYQRMRGKKFALTMGIKRASNDLLLLTDADCVPRDKSWIRKMVAPFIQDHIGVVLGVSPYERTEGFLNRLIRFDAAQIAFHYLGFALGGHPYMGVGRNLAYRKHLFIANSGFKSHFNLASGDDDLFVSEVATRRNTAVVPDHAAQTVSAAEKSWSRYFSQKRRHFTTSPYYRASTKILLLLWPLSLFILWTLALTIMIMHNAFWIGLTALLLRYVAHLATFKVSLKRIGQQDLLPWAPLLEGTLWLIHPLLYLWNQLSAPKKWK